MSDFLALNHNQLAQAIALTGHKEPILVEGDMGSGKSSLHQLVFEYLKEYDPATSYTMIYIDCTTKLDSGDSFMIKYSEDGTTFHHVPHEELGLHLDGPCIIMFEELDLIVVFTAHERDDKTMQITADRVLPAFVK